MTALHRILRDMDCLWVILLLAALCACQNEFIPNENESPGVIEFGARVRQNAQVSSRAEGLDSVYITTDPFNMDFYIQLNCDDGPEPKVEYGTYVIPSGYEGQLSPKLGTEELNWHDLTSEHVFYAWNLTWDPYKSTAEDLVPWSDQIYNGSNPPSADPLLVRFYDSEGENGYSQYHNNSYLENFVGAKTVPFVYKKHGKYVDMTFYHLVSRINVANFILIETDGAIQENLKANITFINMPTKATFYPHPAGGGRPCIKDPIADENVGLTYYIINSPTPEVKDIFYVCPEIDFSQIDYKIQLTSDAYKEYDTYYGSFEHVEFVRNEGWGYDKADGSDAKVLHAGEEMTLNITLIPGKGPGLAVVISPWSTDKPTDSQYHTYPGIYTDAELNELRSLFLALMSTDDEVTLDKLKQLFDLYGVTKDDIKYFMLYDNLTLTGNEANIFPVWKEYILDGLGHTITMKYNTGNYWNTGNKPYFNTGPVRDIYFTDPSGQYTIYIDKDGYVWVTNKETGLLEKTSNFLEDLNTKDGGKWNSYDINIETGEIRPSTYFNGHITG